MHYESLWNIVVLLGRADKMAKPIVTIESYERGITNFPIIDMLESQ